MSAPPNRTDLAGTPTVATYKIAIGLLYDYVAGLLGNGTATIATSAEQVKAREYLGVGATGFKNRFVNPEFLIDQEFAGASISLPVSATPKYLVDQWYGLSTGVTITAQQIAGINSREFSLRFTGATGNTGLTLGHRIESASCYDFKNQTVTVSFKAKASIARVVTWTASYATVNDTFTTVTQIATGTLNITTSVTDFSFSFNAGANAPNGLQITFATTALLAGATIDFDQMQIEKSSVATEFQARSIQQELALCQRYWENGYARNQSGSGTGSHVAYCFFKIAKRVTPTLTNNFSGSGSSAYLQQTPSIYGFEFGPTASGTGSANCQGDWTANARL